MKDSSKWKLKQIFQIFQAHCNRRGTTDIDLFVSRVSHFISRKLNPFSKGMDAFQGSWKYQRKVCSSIFQPDWKSVEEKSDGPSSDLTGGNSNLAKSVLVSKFSSDFSRQTHFDSTSRGSFDGPKSEKVSINRDRKIKTYFLDNFREKVFADGISKSVTELIASAKRQGSITHYESPWGSRKQVGVIGSKLIPSVALCIQKLFFLGELFYSGLEWSTFAGYRSSISVFHDPIEGFLLGKHPRVDSLLKGPFNKRKAIRRYTFIWDIQKVLTYLSTIVIPGHLLIRY